MEVAAHHLEGIAMDSFAGLLASADDNVGREISSPLAIHVYSKLAKLHKHSLIPHLPRIMASVLASLSSSQQLHSACVQVVTALAAHTIDSSRDPASNEDTLRNLCRPLLSALSVSHPPHLAAGAASCLQGLVESDRWRCAPLDLQELVCTKGMQALMDEGTQTVAHMDLMQSLAKLSSSVVIQGYGARLLGAGMCILQNSCSTEKRVAAAQLLKSVLKIADAELLDLDLSPIVGALEECKQDKVAGVRSAVADALRSASMYATYDTASQRIHVPVVEQRTEKDLQQSIVGLQMMSHKTSPAIGCNVLPDASLPNGGTPCHSMAFTSTPSLNKSDKWLKRLPLAPLQQASSVVNPTLVSSSRRRPATFKFSDDKENIAPAPAPAHNTRRAASSRDQARVMWMSKRESPMLWPRSGTKKAPMESLSLFDSPQTPTVPFSWDNQAGDGDFSVNTLLEKHFGKQRDCFEDHFEFSLGKGPKNKIGSFMDESCYNRERQYRDEEICNSVDCDTRGRRSSDSTSTNMCCGTEGPYSPDEESASGCESSVTSEHVSNPQVTADHALISDLLMTPKKLICSLQFDDDCQSNGSFMESDAMSSDTGSGMYDMSESEEYGKDSKVDIDCAESIASSPCPLSEKCILQNEDAQNYSEEYETKRGHNEVIHGHELDTHEGNGVGGGLSSLDIAGGRADPEEVERKSAKPIQKTQSSECHRFQGKAWGFLLLFLVIGVFCAWIMTYMGGLEASNMLMPT